MTNFISEPSWQCVLSHTSFLCLTCSAGMSSLSCFCSRQMFLWTAATTITHNSLYSFMLLLHFWLAAEVGGKCSEALLSLWKPPFAAQTASRGHPSNWQFLKSPSVGCSCRCTSLWQLWVPFRVHRRFCAPVIISWSCRPYGSIKRTAEQIFLKHDINFTGDINKDE